MNRRERLIARTRQGYRLAFGSDGPHPRRFFAAPGRVNLIGEHVDYNDGYVVPCAINRETVVSIGPGDDVKPKIEAVALDMGNARDSFALDQPIAKSDNSWQNLVRGVVHALRRRGHTLRSSRIAMAGDVPIGAGLSSSASFAVAVTLALAEYSRVPLSPDTLALVAQEAENEFLGTQCGIMDQMAASASKKGHALLVDCRSLQNITIPVAKNLDVVIIDSGVRRELAESAFNERREQCEVAARYLGANALRDVTIEALEEAKDGFDPTLYRRARHVVSEIARIEPMAVALAQGDTAALSAIMHAGHTSLHEDYEVTVPEVDALADLVRAVLQDGESPLGGVRMTGAGFGGCLVAVVHTSATQTVLDAVRTTYNAQTKRPASAEVYEMAGGAREITPHS